jgi:hypothetical protein
MHFTAEGKIDRKELVTDLESAATVVNPVVTMRSGSANL